MASSQAPGAPVQSAITVGRTWQLWAHRYESGKFHNVGKRRWVELHLLDRPVVPVLAEEVLGDRLDPAVTHYGWQDAEERRHRAGDEPTVVQVRAAILRPPAPPEACQQVPRRVRGLDGTIRDAG